MNSSGTWLDRLALLAKYRRFLMRWLLLWIIVGVIAAFVWPPRYRATATFLPPTEENAGLLSGLGSQFKLGNVSDIEGKGFLAIMRSRSIKDSLNPKYNFMKRYGTSKTDKAYEEFDNHLLVSSESEEGIGLSRIHAYYVSVTDKDPAEAAAITNDVIYFADRITSRLTSQRARVTREFIEERVQVAKEALRIAEDSLRAFSVKTGIVAPEAQIEGTIKSLGILEQQIAGTEVQLYVARTTLGVSHPTVKEAEARRFEMERQRSELMGSADKSIASDFIGLKKSPELVLIYARKYREVRTQEVLVNFLTGQLEQARFGELRNAPILRVMDRAITPESRRWPIRSVVVLFSITIGLFSGVLWIGWKEWTIAMQGSEFNNQFKAILAQFAPMTLLRVLFGQEK